MGAGQSTSQAHPPSKALHVLRVTPSSPASETTIEPFFDFVVGFDGQALSTDHTIDASELERIVEAHEGHILNLLVWNSKTQDTRAVPITPSREWSQPHLEGLRHQDPDSAPQPSLLGLSMRICEPELASENVWHVLDVVEGSPAESAGLVPMGDWILGWSGGVLSAENDFYDLVEAHVEKPLRVYVYSHDFDTIREVVLVPNRHWGGDGLLGCVFGFGLLHRIPPPRAGMPPELEEPEDQFEEQALFVPADAPPDIQVSAAQLAEWRRQEQEEWTRENLARSMYGQSKSPQIHLNEDHESADTHTHTHQDLDSPLDQDQEIEAGEETPRPTQTFAPNRTPTRPPVVPKIHGLTPMLRPSSPFLGYTRPVIARRDSMQLIHFRSISEQSSNRDDEKSSVTGSEATSPASLTSVE